MSLFQINVSECWGRNPLHGYRFEPGLSERGARKIEGSPGYQRRLATDTGEIVSVASISFLVETPGSESDLGGRFLCRTSILLHGL